jgi:adenosine kinase
MAFDTIAVFEGRFKEHILADRIQSLSVSFLVPSMRKEYGGCSGNIAYNMNLLGGKPVPVATVGEDAGEYMERMAGLGIDVSRVKVIPETFTAQCFITTDLDDNQITAFHPGAMSHAAENDLSDADAAWAIVAPDAKEGMFAHAERLHKRGIPFIFDLGQAMPLFDGADLERMLKLAQALTVNDYEAGVVEQRTGRSMADIAGGDAQRGGLLYGLTSGWNWEDSCRLGNVMGAIKIASRGPQNHAPSRAEIDAVLHATYGIHLPL